MRTLPRLLFIAAAIAAGHPGGATGSENARASEVTCTNLASHADWKIIIDIQKQMVNSQPARISDSQITWYDGKENANYTLDRRTGALESVIPSSTGGFFLHYRCKLNGN
jgi:hypothetical protein